MFCRRLEVLATFVAVTPIAVVVAFSLNAPMDFVSILVRFHHTDSRSASPHWRVVFSRSLVKSSWLDH
jgi:hypothetical protein